MPQRHLILPDLDLAYLCYSGHVTLQDQRQIIAAVASDPAHHPEMLQLSDTSEMTGTDVGLTELLAMRDALNDAYGAIEGPILWAQYAPNDLGYGMARMVQSVFSQIEAIRIELFQDPYEALAFLGLAETDAAEGLGLR